MLGIFVSLLVGFYDNLAFSKQVKGQKIPFNVSKKKKIFTDKYFFYKSMLSLKLGPEQKKSIEILKQKMKEQLRKEKNTTSISKKKYNNYFFEYNYVLNQKSVQNKTLNLNLENLSKLKNFNTDLVIKDNIICQNNNLAKQQR